jgi:hypothetical protein
MITDTSTTHINPFSRIKSIVSFSPWTINVLATLCFIVFIGTAVSAQAVKPCDTWLTDFITVAPKMSDGGKIETYVARKLQSDTSLKYAANCMVGLRILVNCNGKFSYDTMQYRNSASSAIQCSNLLKTTEEIMAGIKEFSPGTIDKQKKDFVFKLVVRVTHGGIAKAEILY